MGRLFRDATRPAGPFLGSRSEEGDAVLGGLFSKMFSSAARDMVSIPVFLLYIKISLTVKVFLTFICSCGGRYAGDFIAALTLLPSVIYIMVVVIGNGVKTNMTITNTFDLIHFHSMPKDTGRVYSVFVTVNANLITNVKCLKFTMMFTLVLKITFLVYGLAGVNSSGSTSHRESLEVAVPRSLSCAGVFSSLLGGCAAGCGVLSTGAAGVNDVFGLACRIALEGPDLRGRFVSTLEYEGNGLRVVLSTRRTAIGRLWGGRLNYVTFNVYGYGFYELFGFQRASDQ